MFRDQNDRVIAKATSCRKQPDARRNSPIVSVLHAYHELVSLTSKSATSIWIGAMKSAPALRTSTTTSSRTFFVWIFFLKFRWETFQLATSGLILRIIYSALLFYEIVRLPRVDDEGLQT
ncbi:hypothetical protein BM221_009468 [Beauveria bassiana]|uniref:Uncharacterized protein n=1 Tax=Beauveria bassiana TaxID=176275 RepID=A0A2N6NBH5_BEABA|nr:hypothetical protein BM221_009468 [Beauveria bassiana]